MTFTSVWGMDACDIAWPPDTDTTCGMEGGMVALSAMERMKSNTAYDMIALSIAAYEGSPEVNAFTSKWDYSLMEMATLSKTERKGFALFQGKGKCKSCHVGTGRHGPFTDFTYDNLGIPRNPENPVYTHDPGFIDYGLGSYLQHSGYPATVWEPEMGEMKVPTLRNVDRRPLPRGNRSRPICTTATSRRSRGSCTSTTPATSSRSAPGALQEEEALAQRLLAASRGEPVT